jgi:hypothetical protein
VNSKEAGKLAEQVRGERHDVHVTVVPGPDGVPVVSMRASMWLGDGSWAFYWWDLAAKEDWDRLKASLPQPPKPAGGHRNGHGRERGQNGRKSGQSKPGKAAEGNGGS